MSCRFTGLLAHRKDLLSALCMCWRSSLPANSDLILPQRCLISTDNFCRINCSQCGAPQCPDWCPGMGWHHTLAGGLGKKRTGVKAETSVQVPYSAMSCCTGTHCIPVVYSLSCMLECVLCLQKDWDWRWDGEHAGVWGFFAIWCDILARVAGEEQRECWK